MLRVLGLVFIFCLGQGVILGQDKFQVNYVDIEVTGMRPHTVRMPEVIETLKPHSQVATDINTSILRHFDLENYWVDPDKDMYSWFIDTVYVEQGSSHIYFHFVATYVSNRAYDHDWEVYFDLTSGEMFNGQTVDFHTLFQPDVYLPFIDSFWKPIVSRELELAYECDVLWYVDERNSVSRYVIENDSITLKSMSYRDFPTMYWECAPYVNVKMSIEAIKKYLSPAGRVFLEEVNLAGGSKLKVFEANQKFLTSAIDAMYIFGKIDSLYPMSIYLEIDKERHEVAGWYYYDKYKVRIALKGSMTEGVIMVDESATNGMAAGITFTSNQDEALGYFSSMYDVEGTWFNPVKGELLEILITDFLVSPL